MKYFVAFLLGFLLMTVLLLCSTSRGHAQEPAHDWAALLKRVQSSGNVIQMEMRFRPGAQTYQVITGSLIDFGTDYICVAEGGNTSCAQFDAVSRIITPPGTFGRTATGR